MYCSHGRSTGSICPHCAGLSYGVDAVEHTLVDVEQTTAGAKTVVRTHRSGSSTCVVETLIDSLTTDVRIV